MRGIQMYINLNPFTIGINDLSFNNLVSLAKKYGFGGVEFLPQQFDSVEQAKEAGELMNKLSLQWGLFPLPCDFSNVSDEEFEEGISKLKKVLPLVKAAGCKRAYNHIWPGSNSKPYEENFMWHVEKLKVLVELLGSYDVKLGLEFIGAKTLRDSFKYPFIFNIHQALELANAVSPDLGIIIDCFHLYTSGGKAEDILAVGSGDRIVNVHANDAFPGRAREEQQDLERQLPMTTGIVDIDGILKVLKQLEYDGPVICEPFQPTVGRYQGMPDEEVAVEVSQVMKKLFSKVN
jgi:sugar phosphate isomerase/epimerase